MYKLFLILITASACTLSPQEQIQLLEIENLSLKEEIKELQNNQEKLADDNLFLIDDNMSMKEEISRIQDELYSCNLYTDESNKLLVKYKKFLLADYQSEIDRFLELEIY